MKMEACAILDPTYLGPATIQKVRAHLLYLSFDGWPAILVPDHDTHFWSHAESSEIYPVGYAEMVGHNFQGRVQPNNLQNIPEQFSTKGNENKNEEIRVSSSTSSNISGE